MKFLRLVRVRMLAVLFAVLLVACGKKDNSIMYKEIKSVDKMVFASMAISKTAVMKDPHIFLLGDRVAVYSYNTYLQAYINLADLKPDDLVFDDKNHTVTLTLPPVRTELVGRDMQMRKIYENISPLRSQITSEERAQIKEKANRSLISEVVNNPEFRRQVTEAAQSKARAYFEYLLEQDGYTPTILFKTDKL